MEPDFLFPNEVEINEEHKFFPGFCFVKRVPLSEKKTLNICSDALPSRSLVYPIQFQSCLHFILKKTLFK